MYKRLEKDPHFSRLVDTDPLHSRPEQANCGRIHFEANNGLLSYEGRSLTTIGSNIMKTYYCKLHLCILLRAPHPYGLLHRAPGWRNPTRIRDSPQDRWLTVGRPVLGRRGMLLLRRLLLLLLLLVIIIINDIYYYYCCYLQ